MTKQQLVDIGESVPVRLFLSPLPISPTYANIENKFSVRYYVNLVLVDDGTLELCLEIIFSRFGFV
jgi:hypothetical protein